MARVAAITLVKDIGVSAFKCNRRIVATVQNKLVSTVNACDCNSVCLSIYVAQANLMVEHSTILPHKHRVLKYTSRCTRGAREASYEPMVFLVVKCNVSIYFS